MNVDGLNLLNSLYLNTKTNNLTNSILSPNASNTNASIFDFNQGGQASAVELLLGVNCIKKFVRICTKFDSKC